MNSGRVVIARIRRARGNKGELAAESLAEDPTRFDRLSRVLIDGREHPVERFWWHADTLVMKLQGVDSISAAERFADKDVEIPAEERAPLPEGQYYVTDLLGCRLYDRGEPAGEVTGWQELPGGTLLEIGGREGFEVPYRLIDRVDLANRRLDATLPEGLRDLNR